MAALTIVSLANAAVVTWLVLRSGASRLPLVFAIFIALWGVQTFLAQVEVLVFPAVGRRLPEGFVPRAMLAGALHAGLFAPLAVAVLGAWRRGGSAGVGWSPWPAGRLALRIAGAAAVFVALYFLCGYFIAWRQPVLAAYYEGADPGSFAAQMRAVVRDAPWLPAVQVARGILWTLFVLPAVVLLRRSRAETAAFAAALAGVTSLLLLLPNPYMPFEVRMIHLVETVTANAIFGAFVGWLFSDGSVRPSGVEPERVNGIDARRANHRH